jgi:hypothetical protein
VLEERSQLGQGENEDEVEKELDRGHPLLVGGGPFDVAPCFLGSHSSWLTELALPPKPTHAGGKAAGDPGAKKRLGVVEIMAGVRIRREVRDEWLLYVSGGASVLFGLLLPISPGTGAVALVWLIGIYALIFGVVLVALALRLRRMREAVPPGASPAV